MPAYVRPTKSGSSQSTRCSTIHRSTRWSSEINQGVVTVVVTVTVWRVAATGTIVRVSVVAPSGVSIGRDRLAERDTEREDHAERRRDEQRSQHGTTPALPPRTLRGDGHGR